MSRRWFVVGSAGMLGRDLVDLLETSGADVVGHDRDVIDITSASSVASVLDDVAPAVVVNVAAYTAVDAAETDEATALLVNGTGPGILARDIARRPNVRLVQISTDYVFPGDATEPYAEDAATGPHSAYGRTKLAGELAVRNALPDRGIIVRTAWLYGEHGPNFVSTMLRLEREKDTIDVVDDQRGQPTWTRDLADFVHRLVEADVPAGAYHGTSSGETTWFGLAQEVFRLAGADPLRVRPTTTDKFPRPAPRPHYSVLGHTGSERHGVRAIGPWEQGLAGFLTVQP
jgi:dTDP-4-dehydrorhamnose reductase